MTIKQAQKLVQGQWIYHKIVRDSCGEPSRVKVLSVKTWKRAPSRVDLSVKYGLYEFFHLNENELEVWSSTLEGAYNAKEKRNNARRNGAALLPDATS